MIKLASIFEHYHDSFMVHHADRLLPTHRQAIGAIVR